jgi:hypothetical protein
MSATRLVIVTSFLVVCACTTPESTTLQPHLAFAIGGEIGLTAARDFTVDHEGNVFVFDYGDYVIRKFESGGALLTTFGGTGNEPGRFEHLMEVKAHGDSLLALDPGAVSVFDLSGNLRARRALADTITCDHPALHPGGEWAAGCIVDATAEMTLTYREADGSERRRVAAFDLGEFFPGVEPGGFFFIHPTQAPSYLYDFTPNARLLWAVSDRLRVLVDQEGVDETLFEAKATALPYPATEITAMEERQASLQPPLFMNVPHHYQLIQHLVVSDVGDIWLYVTSQERTGLLRLSPTGSEQSFYPVSADFDVLSARIAVANGGLYFMVPSRESTEIYRVELP